MVRSPWGENSETFKEVGNMQQVKQMFEISAVMVGVDAQVEVLPS